MGTTPMELDNRLVPFDRALLDANSAAVPVIGRRSRRRFALCVIWW
jgi:hypothetical protein